MPPIIPQLIPEWKSAWRWSSVRLMALSGMIQGVLMAFPDQLKTYISPDVLKYLSEAALAILILAGIGRITARPGDDNVQPPHSDSQP
jgi:hypothetical protein